MDGMDGSGRRCSIGGCDLPHLARGWCRAHYDLWYRHGDPLSAGRPSAEEAFRARVDARGPCHLWTGPRSREGFGLFWYRRARVHAERFAYATRAGPIPPGMVPVATCGNRLCVNVDHLTLVTRREFFRRSGGAAGRAHRQTRCKRGHPFDAANTIVRPNGSRACRACINEQARARRRAGP